VDAGKGKSMPHHKKTQRNKQIYRDKSRGMRSKDIAHKHGISVYRVYEILKLMGYNFYAKGD
jgi:Mor family transcriptional regulator